jgi:hypothetical protein
VTETRTETGGPTRTPRSEITPAVSASRKKEPVCLLDLSGSMDWEAEPGGAEWNGDSGGRRGVVVAALPLLVRHLESLDSEAAAEQAEGDDDRGGLLVHGFSGGHVEIGDLNSSNIGRKLAEVAWGGGTHVMPAWKAARADYDEEFGDREPEDQPTLLTLVITDGEADDWDAFAPVLEKADAKHVFAVAIVGHGDAHDRTLRAYKAAADRNKAQDKYGKSHVSVVSFDGVTNPAELAEDLITLVG